jgi:hypothetical protein
MWSLRQRIDGKWQVVGHCESCVIMGVSVRQSEKARQTVIATGQRSVHCWVTGELVKVTGLVSFKDRVTTLHNMAHDDIADESMACAHVTYNPHINETLIYKATGAEYDGSEWAVFTTEKHMFVA